MRPSKIKDEAAFASMWNRGFKGSIIASHFGVTTATVYSTASRLGLAHRGSPHSTTPILDGVRPPWSSAWCDPAHTPYFAGKCQALWARVLLDGIREAVSDRARGMGWIGSHDFHHVCQMAGFDGRTICAELSARWGDPDLATALRLKAPRKQKEAAHV